MRIRLLAGLLAILATFPADAHEFWVMPERFQLEVGETIDIDLREGDNFAGKSISYHPRRFHRFELSTPTGIEMVLGKDDAVPAASLKFDKAGLNVLAYQSKLSLLTYNSYEKFTNFLESMQLNWAIAEHDRRGLARENVREAYFRYAKALVQVGNEPAGADAAIGMPLELVALNNPYLSASGPQATTLSVQLYYKGDVYADYPLFVFRRTATGVDKKWYRTDAQGIAAIDLPRGGDYQINAVHLQAANDRMTSIFGAVWQTLWASMTLAIAK